MSQYLPLDQVPLLGRRGLVETAVAPVLAAEPRRVVAPSPPPPAPAETEWETVVVLRRRAAAEISDRVEHHQDEYGRTMPDSDRRLMGRAVIRQVVRAHAEHLQASGSALWDMDTEESYVRAVSDAVFGFGRLQPLFEIPDAENIEIHGCDSVVVQYGDGRREEHPPVAGSDEELVEAIRFLGEQARPSRPFDDAHPTMTLALGDRYRLHAIGFGLSYRPSVTIRQHLLTDVGLADLVATGMLTEDLARYLHAAVMARRSIVVSGDQGAGKTTLLRALVAAIPPTERFGTLETDYELLTHLLPGRRNIVALQARIGQGEVMGGHRIGEVTVADLLPEALRQNLSRLVVGEVRGAEAGAMFEAMQSGAGTLCTTHSHSAAATMDRLASRAAQGGVLTVEEAYRQIAHNIDLFIHVQLVDDTWRGGTRRRRVGEVREVTGGLEGGRPVTHLAYTADPGDGRGPVLDPTPESLMSLDRYRAAWPGQR